MAVRTVAIIQARLGSERLPGKALLHIGDKTILERVIDRVRMIEGVENVALATSWLSEDEQLMFAAPSRNGDVWFRGHPTDVLDRFYSCAHECEATHILRVTADCPLLDPTLNTRILDKLVNSDADYVSISTRSVGLVQEAFTVEALEQAWEATLEPYDREHVVPWMIRHLKCKFLKPPFDLGSTRLCVDTLTDLDYLRGLYAKHPNLFEMSAKELVAL